MADPKGPGSDKTPGSGYSARPKSQTLDLSATDVTSKDAKDKEAKDKASAQSSTSSAPEPTKPAASSGASSASSAATSTTSVSPKPTDPAKASTTPSSAATSATSPSSPTSKPAEASATPAAKPSEPSTASKPASSSGATTKPEAKPASAATPKPAAQPTISSTPPREGVGVLGVAAAALAGAAIAVLVIAVFGKHLIRAPEPDMTRVTAAESKLDAVSRDIAALRGELAKAAASSDTGALEKRLADVGKSVETSNGRVEGVEKQVKAIADKVAKPGVDPTAIGALAGRLDGVDLRLQALPSTEALAGLAARVDAAETKVKDSPTPQQMAMIASRLAAVPSQIEQATKPIADKVASLDATVKSRPPGDPAARLVVALSALQNALDAGRPFPSELAAVKASAQNEEISGLQQYAAAGVPTREALSAELGAIMNTLPPEKAAQGETSIFEKLVANAGAIVKVTPKDKGAAGATPGAGRDRVAQLASDGDLDQALAARSGLDDADQSATEEWAKKASARVAADKAVAGARTAALSRLANTD